MADNSSARMTAFECPICAPKRYFITEIGLRTHVADRHPWRSLPPAQSKIPPSKAALPDPAWLREQQTAAAAAAAYGYTDQMAMIPSRQHAARGPSHHGHHHHANNLAVTFDTQSQLSDEVFIDDAGVSGRGRQQLLQPSPRRPMQNLQGFNDPRYYNDSSDPPPDYDPPTPGELSRAIDAIDSTPRKRRDIATARRPWYDSADYEGPRNLMEKPGGYYRFGKEDPQGGDVADAPVYSRQRMTRELDDRDSRIETLRLEIDRLWDERMRLLKQEAERTRIAKEQQQMQVFWRPQPQPGGDGGAGGGFYGQQQLQPQRRYQQNLMDFQGGGMGMNNRRIVEPTGHAFQPVLPHSRLQLYRVEQPRQQLQPMGRRAIDY